MDSEDKNTDTFPRNEVIKRIRNLVNQKGYIYVLCMIMFEDFHVDIEKAHEVDYRSRLSTKEASFLLGFLIQKEIDLSPPESPQELIKMRQETYKLMQDLHDTFIKSFIDRLKISIEEKPENKDFRSAQKSFFGEGAMLTEPIFYSGTGVYDFQYLDFLERKYRYDTDRLREKCAFDISKTQKIVRRIKEVLQKKSHKVHLYHPKEKLPEVIRKKSEERSDVDWEKQANDILPMLELYQYIDLFLDNAAKEGSDIDSIREEGWQSFYKGLIDLFVINKADFENDLNIDFFLKNFSILPKDDLNSAFNNIGDFNIFNARPIIQLDSDRYFVPIAFCVFEAVYESPFYWMIDEMIDDKNYFKKNGALNRGKVSEEITFELLEKVFGKKKYTKIRKN